MNPKRITQSAAACLLLAGSLYFVSTRPNIQSPSNGIPTSSTGASVSNYVYPAAQASAGPIEHHPVMGTDHSGTALIAKKQLPRTTAKSTDTGRSSDRSRPKSVQTSAAASVSAEASGDATQTPRPANPVSLGVRLAPDVRLPVAAMPIDFTISPVAQTALEQIVTDYYKEISASVSETPAESAVTEESCEGETTLVVSNGPTVDAARKRADYRFKALFGNDAYNRMTINTLLEARLPQSSPE